MDRPFNAGDRKKRVVSADGQQLGRISDVENDVAMVDRDDDEGLTDDVKIMLGWSDDGDDSFEIRRDHVDRYNEEELHLHPRR